MKGRKPRHADVQLVQSRSKRQEAQLPSFVRRQRRRPSDHCWRAEANDRSGNRTALNIADGSDEHARQALCGSHAAQQDAGKNSGQKDAFVPPSREPYGLRDVHVESFLWMGRVEH